MCSICSSVSSVLAIRTPHRSVDCPLALMLYCSICCDSGHSTERCPNTEAKAHREVEFVEQLVPPSLLVQHGILTRTPLPKKAEKQLVHHAAVWEVEDNEKTIRHLLLAAGITPSGLEKRNRRMLKQLADGKGLHLVYLS